MSRAQLQSLCIEAAEAGNIDLVRICLDALDGDEIAIGLCKLILRDLVAREAVGLG